MTEIANVNQAKKMQLEAVFQRFNEESDCKIKEEATKNKLSNLVLMTLQDDKKRTDCWDAFGRVDWGKSF
ncbi:MAG TPA: hypothetical protein VGZ69_01270 [Candidatus Rhabdochlamydia sp.]|jgi:hypothetical protein|nr:hypothetical protein [Candidatus Rhabdochlamydia sp.]